MAERRERGLPSINQAREERRRAIVAGRVRIGGLPPHFWLWAVTILSAVLVIYWRVETGRVESAKGAVMAKQRAIAATLGPQIVPFRDRVEGWVKELSGEVTTYAAEGVSLAKLEREPSVYLRLRLSNAASPKEIRKAAVQSLRDGFTSCLLVSKGAPDQARGPACRTTGDCDPGFLCNEWQVCVEPSSPFNLRLAYRALRVLSTEWTDELHAASSLLEVNAYDRDLVKVRDQDVPIAAKLLARSKYFVLVLDEDPPGGLPAEVPDAGETPAERVQRTAHFARVGIWELESGKPLLKLRAEAGGEFVPVGKRPVEDPRIIAAQQRQVNSCALALAVKAKLENASAQ